MLLIQPFRERTHHWKRDGCLFLTEKWAFSMLIESNGFDKHVAFRYSECEITGRLPSHAEPVVGETVPVAMDLSKISLFDEQSEKRI